MYSAPVEEIAFTLNHVAGLAPALEEGRFGDLSGDVVSAILEEAGRFASSEIAPLGEKGDREGASIEDGEVTTPKGWPALYRRWREGGWNGLTAPEAYGGQNLPHMLNVAALEMWNSASMAFALAPTLTMGAIEALSAHGSDELKQTFLEKMISGEWTGTMNLTEPHAGSDLGVLKTRAERREDGTYRIFGQKIFITWGEHDVADNIIHLVLARLPDAPAGTRGISLFLVPKFLVNADGSLGERNDVLCHSIEHKLGIHGSPTCTMIFGDGRFGEEWGAVGYLLGEENKGLACMFTMMNNARLAVGIQGVAIAEAATQKAIAYAKERTQGKAPGWSAPGHNGAQNGTMSPIILHPDVAQMLLTMKALTQGARAICYACAHATDMSHHHQGEAAGHWAERAALLTPIAKSFATDIGVDVASLGIQVHGGMGFIEETGAARYLRDARIAPIYEGTNGIQAIDLVTRKLPLSGGEQVRGFLDELKQVADEVLARNDPAFGETGGRLRAAIAALETATNWLLQAQSDGHMTEALAGATPYQRLFGLVLTGVYLARGALVAADNGGETSGRVSLCRFMAENLLAETSALKDRVVAGAPSLAAARAVLD
jgi:alkylation response protein AidB-like acyl-CoA dehydrogenase